ncbi:immunoglobulin superfamily member 6 isoform X1 [Rhincodon typus]|uniref:immunoglobulin superfamily member 6 isoform X1 n=1 Tax=Rhincodon typus TaxID=259920 RepID=UPI0009A3EC4B|nr:immunoglobulin superfamily member 6 isoform X1 [Rhincodon typus]
MELTRRLTEVFFLYLQVSNFYIAGFASKDCTVTVNQEPFIEGHLTENVTINCTFTHANCFNTPKVLWFRINTNQTTNLCSGACSSESSNGRFTLSGTSSGGNAALRIQQLTKADNGMYYCGVAFQKSPSIKSKQMGNGTMLVLKGPTDIGSDLLLQSTLILILTLYTICITILLAQTIRLMQQANSNHNHSRNDPNEEQKSRAFKDLALEFNKKYRNKKQETEVSEEKQEAQLQCAQYDDSIYQNA